MNTQRKVCAEIFEIYLKSKFFFQVVQLGVRISPESGSTTVISLFYTDSSQIASQSIANFTVPKFYGKWMRFSFRVSTENVTLFYNCNETETIPVQRQPLELEFVSASTLYLAQAGPTIGDPYEVSDFGVSCHVHIITLGCQRKTQRDWNVYVCLLRCIGGRVCVNSIVSMQNA